MRLSTIPSSPGELGYTLMGGVGVGGVAAWPPGWGFCGPAGGLSRPWAASCLEAPEKGHSPPPPPKVRAQTHYKEQEERGGVSGQ